MHAEARQSVLEVKDLRTLFIFLGISSIAIDETCVRRGRVIVM